MSDLTTTEAVEMAELADILGTDIPNKGGNSSIVRVPEACI